MYDAKLFNSEGAKRAQFSTERIGTHLKRCSSNERNCKTLRYAKHLVSSKLKDVESVDMGHQVFISMIIFSAMYFFFPFGSIDVNIDSSLFSTNSCVFVIVPAR